MSGRGRNVKNFEESYSNMISRLFIKRDKIKTDDDFSKYSARTVTIQVTDHCNLACTYCYQINKKTHVIPFELGAKFLDDLLDGKYDNYCNYSNSEAIILEFIGGEPFLQIDLIDKFTDYFIQGMINRNHPWLNRFRISICSNGTLYFQPKVQEYIRKNINHLSFSISIDGNKQLHDACRVFPDGSGSYDMAMAAVNHYRETYNRTMGSKMTIAPGNIDYLYDAVIGLIENGYRNINLNCVYEKGWNLEYATRLYYGLKNIADYLLETELYKETYLSIFEETFFGPKSETDVQNWCGGTGAMLSVDWKGDLYPCIRYMESSLGNNIPPVIIGNVNTGILCTEEQCKICQEMNAVDRRTQSTDECFNCPIAAGCSWCSAYNYQTFGTVNKRATFICPMHKARALANVYYWNMQYRLDGEYKRFVNYVPDEWALEIIDQDELDFLKVLALPEEF